MYNRLLDINGGVSILMDALVIILIEFSFLILFIAIDKANNKEVKKFKCLFIIVNIVMNFFHLGYLLAPSILIVVLMILCFDLFITFIIEATMLFISFFVTYEICDQIDNYDYSIVFFGILLAVTTIYVLGGILFAICKGEGKTKKFVEYVKMTLKQPVDEAYRNNIYISYLLILILCNATEFNYSGSVWYDLLNTTFVVLLAVFQIDWNKALIPVIQNFKDFYKLISK